MADIGESESKPKILVTGGDEYFVEWLNKQKGLNFVFWNLYSDFKDCQGILFPPSILSIGGHFEEVIDLFKKDLSRFGGIEGVVMYIWLAQSDWKLEDEIVKRLRLKERGCVWEFGAGGDAEIIPKMDQFFKENVQTIVLKPAKRDK